MTTLKTQKWLFLTIHWQLEAILLSSFRLPSKIEDILVGRDQDGGFSPGGCCSDVVVNTGSTMFYSQPLENNFYFSNINPQQQ